MLGDTAVAVHPDDERYRDLVGKHVVLPLVGRRIPIVADDYSDPEKGSGAVKITPAHDFNDFEVGRRHHLRMINVLDVEARMLLQGNDDFLEGASDPGLDAVLALHGQDRFAARKAVLAMMEERGFSTSSSRTRIWCPTATAPASSSSPISPTSGTSTPRRWRSRR
jgi:valyl-tRNA synthetase